MEKTDKSQAAEAIEYCIIKARTNGVATIEMGDGTTFFFSKNTLQSILNQLDKSGLDVHIVHVKTKNDSPKDKGNFN